MDFVDGLTAVDIVGIFGPFGRGVEKVI
jgi:hypothetical protein